MARMIRGYARLVSGLVLLVGIILVTRGGGIIIQSAIESPYREARDEARARHFHAQAMPTGLDREAHAHATQRLQALVRIPIRVGERGIGIDDATQVEFAFQRRAQLLVMSAPAQGSFALTPSVA